MLDNVQDIRSQVASANRVLAQTGMATGVLASLGHAAMRIPNSSDRFVTKGRGYAVDALALMTADDMLVCDLEANLIEGPPGVTQVSEIMLHACVFRARPDVQAVVHVHPRFATLLSVLGGDIVPLCNEGNVLVREPLPVYPYSRLIVAEEDGLEVASVLGEGKAMLLRGHGALTAGNTLEDAVVSMLELEEQAKMNWYARCAMGQDHPRLSADDVDDWVVSSKLRGQLPHFRQQASAPNESGAKPLAQSGLWAYLTHQVQLPES